ncbi:hypothetical protein [Nocardia altamirensis]|uniref:hypothetical protein n=1 Tax=Nocardia altamirensis TaxID=472158 RepID=UPI0008408354|nr:hypothetical protein [Nocardia altamirensis]
MPADGLKNGDYSLKMVDGNLVLAGPDGRIWDSATNGKGGSLFFRSDGSFDISVSGPYGGYSIWQNGLKLQNVGSLQLTDKGKLVILDKAGKEIHVIAAADGKRHYGAPSVHVPTGSPQWLRSLIDAINTWLRKCYDTIGALKQGDTDELFKMMTGQGLLDPRKEKNTGKLVEQYSKKGDYIVGVKNQLQQGNAQIQVLSLDQIPQKIGQTRGKLDGIVDELNDKLSHLDPEAVITGKEMKPAAAATAVDLLYQAVGRVKKELDAANAFIAEKQREVSDNVPPGSTGTDPGPRNSLPPVTDFLSSTAPLQDMKPLFEDLLPGGDPTKKPTTGGSGLDALLKELGASSAPSTNGSGGAPTGGGPNPLTALMGMLPMLPVIAQQVLSQMRPRNPEQERNPNPNDPNQPNPGNPGEVPPGAPVSDTAPGAPVTAAPATPPPPPPAGRKPWVDMKVENVQQKVPEAVARAVNKEFNDPNGIDARDAYSNTSGQETEDKPWKKVDGTPATGDIVEWRNVTTGEKLSGIVVVNGDTIQLVTHDKLVPLDLQNPPAAGSGPYEFVHFLHPSGVDGDEEPAKKPTTPPNINAVAPLTPAPPSAPATPTPPPRK